MGDMTDIPDSCLNDDHNFGQAGRCKDCGIDRVDTANHGRSRRTGGAGSRTQPLTDEEYREQMKKLQGRE